MYILERNVHNYKILFKEGCTIIKKHKALTSCAGYIGGVVGVLYQLYLQNIAQRKASVLSLLHISK